jgi:hypothetical protein
LDGADDVFVGFVLLPEEGDFILKVVNRGKERLEDVSWDHDGLVDARISHAVVFGMLLSSKGGG